MEADILVSTLVSAVTLVGVADNSTFIVFPECLVEGVLVCGVLHFDLCDRGRELYPEDVEDIAFGVVASAVFEDVGVEDVEGLEGDTDGGRVCLLGSREVLRDLRRDLTEPHSDHSPSPRV